MQCRACGVEFAQQIDLRRGTHAEYECSCGQLLQWDQSVQATGRPEQLRIGPPRPCEHPDLRKPGALVPLTEG